jgi:hypothetical protein
MNDQLIADSDTYAKCNKHKRHTAMPLPGFEPTIPAIKQLQIHDLDRKVTGICP